VNNFIAPLGNVRFRDEGWGKNMYLHVYDLMWPGYIPPTTYENFEL
jgi:hypothetical protein